MSIVDSQDTKQLVAHYNTYSGYGNIYKAWASWPTVLKTIIFGWEGTPEHPAQLHFGLDYDGTNLEASIQKASLLAYRDLDISSSKKATVIEAGCGLGGTSLYLAQKFPKTDFIGVTLSPEQAETAAMRARKVNVTNASYRTESFFELSERTSSVDGIIGMEVFDSLSVSAQPSLFKELFRVLKTGGRVVVFDGFINERLSTKQFNDLYGGFIPGWTVSSQMGSANTFIGNAKEAGFRLIKNEDLTKRMLAASRECAKRAKLMFWYIRAIQPLVRQGIILPLWRRVGFHHPGALEFARSCLIQYNIFKKT